MRDGWQSPRGVALASSLQAGVQTLGQSADLALAICRLASYNTAFIRVMHGTARNRHFGEDGSYSHAPLYVARRQQVRPGRAPQ